MSTQYYYLIAGLPELLSHYGNKPDPYPAFEQLCREELHPGDFELMHRCFLFNDVKNIARIIGDYSNDYSLNRAGLRQAAQKFFESSDVENNADTRLSFPAVYYPQELIDGFSDLDLFLPQISDCLREITQGTHSSTEHNLEDRLLKALFNNLGDDAEITGLLLSQKPAMANNFVEAYLVFEMHLRNLVAALSLRNQEQDHTERIIEFDHFSKRVANHPAPDFGLGADLGVLETLIGLYGKASPLEIEQAIIDARWAFLDEAVAYHHFSREAVFSYALKLSDIRRMLRLQPDDGRQKLDELIESLTTEITNNTREDTAS